MLIQEQNRYEKISIANFTRFFGGVTHFFSKQNLFTATVALYQANKTFFLLESWSDHGGQGHGGGGWGEGWVTDVSVLVIKKISLSQHTRSAGL